jgi:hypothetical protein
MLHRRWHRNVIGDIVECARSAALAHPSIWGNQCPCWWCCYYLIDLGLQTPPALPGPPASSGGGAGGLAGAGRGPTMTHDLHPEGIPADRPPSRGHPRRRARTERGSHTHQMRHGSVAMPVDPSAGFVEGSTVRLDRQACWAGRSPSRERSAAWSSCARGTIEEYMAVQHPGQQSCRNTMSSST